MNRDDDAPEHEFGRELHDDNVAELRAERWASHRERVAATGYPALRLAMANRRDWPAEQGSERAVYLVRSLPGVIGGLSYVETGDQADVHPGLVGHLKVRRIAQGLRVGAALLEPVPVAVLAHMARQLFPCDEPALVEVVLAA
jgi:GNAT superfamily N-acetyltransferase